VPVRLLITVLPLFALVAACGQQVAGTALPGDHDVVVTTVRPSVPKTRSSTPSTTRSSSGRVSVSALAGRWDGSYTCNQGETGLTLTIQNTQGDVADGTFEFFPLANNPNAKSGSFAVKVGYSAGGQLKFTQDKWINEPPGYGMVDLLVPTAPGTDKMTGQVLSDGCTTFSVTHKK
jgi:hypothetical protein